MRRWNLPQVNTKVMCAVLTAAMVMTGFTACGGTTSAGTESAASESAEQKETIAPEGTTEQSTVEQSTETESGEEKVESYLGQITAIDGNVISIALAEKPETPDGETPTGEKSDGQAPDGNGGTPNGEAPAGEVPSGEKSDALEITKSLIPFFCYLLTALAVIFLKKFLDVFLHITRDCFCSFTVCTSKFRNDLFDHTQTLQILRRNVHDFTGFFGTVRILPED